MESFRIGQRIIDTTENARGTVKYLGEFSKFVMKCTFARNFVLSISVCV